MDDSSTEYTIRRACYMLVAFEIEITCGSYTVYQAVDGGSNL